MSLTQFAMVEELAFLIKDNLSCKHLVLSMEETLVDFLQDDTSLDGVLELEPMDPYSRLLLHRLADIFGFSHKSTGEGEDRHLILYRCQESSIPPILVGDLLSDYDECESLTSSQLLSKREVSSVLKERTPGEYEAKVMQNAKAERPITQVSLEEREAAYMAARERIFSSAKEETKRTVKEKPQHNPVVARRMIAHALGHKIEQSDQSACVRNSAGYGKLEDEMDIQGKEHVRKVSLQTYGETNKPFHGRTKVADMNSRELLLSERMEPHNMAAKAFTKVGASGERKQGIDVHKNNMKEERTGAAKRMFANALGIHSTRDTIQSKSSQLKQANK